MPRLRRQRSPEDAPIGDPAQTLVPTDFHRPQPLTVELLDWTIKALEAVLTTPELKQASKRAQSAMSDAMKFLDHLYPQTIEQQEALSAFKSERAAAGRVHAAQGEVPYWGPDGDPIPKGDVEDGVPPSPVLD